MDLPLVSINCITYNHENYIEQALKGFLEQKTDFEFEILVHDDASTDKTSEIIKKYENKYPEIFKVIYQEHNQYSKGISPNEIQFSRSRGKYIALCEGDDYWIDPYKLQKQIDYLETHPKCTFSFTNGKIKDESRSNQSRIFIPYSSENEKYMDVDNNVYNVGELALLGFIPTASFVFRKSILEDLPDYFYKKFPAEDMKIKLTATAMGYAYFLNDITCVYRENVPGSAMFKWEQYNQEKKEKLQESFIELLENVDQYTNRNYTEELSLDKLHYLFNLALIKRDKQLLKNSLFSERLNSISLRSKISIYRKLYFPIPENYRVAKWKLREKLASAFKAVH